jgi:hypothetical protein
MEPEGAANGRRGDIAVVEAEAGAPVVRAAAPNAPHIGVHLSVASLPVLQAKAVTFTGTESPIATAVGLFTDPPGAGDHVVNPDPRAKP